MKIQVTRLTFDALLKKHVDKRATVVAKCGSREEVKSEFMLINKCVRIRARVNTWTHKQYKFVTAFVHGKRTNLTLKPLFAKAPY